MCKYCNRTQEDIDNEVKRKEIISELQGINAEIDILQNRWNWYGILGETFLEKYKILSLRKIEIIEKLLKTKDVHEDKRRNNEKNIRQILDEIQ